MQKLSSALMIAAACWLATAVTVAAPESIADAARNGDLERVRALVAQNADANTAYGDGMTGLHWAARSGNESMVKVLLDAGANVEATTRIGAHTPLHVASKAGRASVVELLLDFGADAGARTKTGATPLHFAAGSGSVEAVIALLEHGAEIDAREPEWEQTPLMFAAAWGRTDVVAALVEHGASTALTGKVVNIVERNDQDAAERRRRNKKIAELRAALIEQSAPSVPQDAPGQPPRRSEPETGTPKPETSSAPEQPLDRDEALRRGGEPVPLDYADLVGTHGGLTPLLLAAREGHTDTVLALLQGGADVNQVSAGDRTSPMLMAMINGHFDLAMELFERGADPNIASVAGATPLYTALNMHWAPKARHPQPVAYQQQKTSYLEVMERLLKAGVDPNVRLEKTLWYTTYNRDLLGVNRAGATLFWRAAHALDIDAMRLLVAYGADPDLATIKVPERGGDEDGGGGGGGDGTDHSGLPPVPLGGPAVYPIHAASGVGHGQGFAGNSHRHVPDGWVPAVKYLVEELGADVNARDHNGYTPLHHAAARGDNELIRYLVSKGADATAVARNGQTTADMANGPVQRVQPYPETVALLMSLGSKNNDNCVSC